MFSDEESYRDPENRRRDKAEFSGCLYVAVSYAVAAGLVLFFWGPCA